MTELPKQVGKEVVRNTRFAYTILGLGLILALVVGGTAIQGNRDRAREGQQAHAALCVLKHDYKERVKQSEKFLKENPKGIPGIPTSVIQNSIKNQKATIVSLKVLKCDKRNS
jgi:hypothetical protein